MKYCYECGKLTAGEPLFCNFCGRSYDVKLCPRLHVNSRVAEVCSQCGSRDFSTPQPRVSVWWRLFAFLVKVAVGALLALIALGVVLAILQQLLESQRLEGTVIALAILLGVLAWIWGQLPNWLRSLIRRVLKRKERGNGH